METVSRSRNRWHSRLLLSALGVSAVVFTACSPDTSDSCRTVEDGAFVSAAAFPLDEALLTAHKARIKAEAGASIGVDQIRNAKIGTVSCDRSFKIDDLGTLPVVKVDDVPDDLVKFCVAVAIVPTPADYSESEYRTLSVRCPAL